ncbi:hypothetical protein [Paenibacillus aceris]|uniref:Transposase InsH N-terminal domain-containing protein n=1 Tax=Paenibacillus aceris TaxID=869555 RepID=A0ABS4I345_9BACL|nr:hypothetical protein [Paenibacillus aceris]MBP1965323.1 hypothetical protein [Paenibacillus aceris]NHW36004.1 hypothetical protein [Paenibacillus aceris]
MTRIPFPRSSEAYLQFVVEQLNLHYGNSKALLQQFYADLILWITPLLDTSLTASIMKNQYSSDPRGRKPHDPADLLRSLLLMNKLHITKVDEWVEKLATIPIYAILSGLPPNATPGVGTFYDFFRRMWLATSAHLTGRKKRKLKKPKRKGKRIKNKNLTTLASLKDFSIVSSDKDEFTIRPKPMISCSSYFKRCLFCLPLRKGCLVTLSHSA